MCRKRPDELCFAGKKHRVVKCLPEAVSRIGNHGPLRLVCDSQSLRVDSRKGRFTADFEFGGQHTENECDLELCDYRTATMPRCTARLGLFEGARVQRYV